MRRVAIIALSFAASVGLAWWWAADRFGAEADKAGKTLYRYHDGYELLTRKFSRRGPLVVWLGDSTIMGLLRPSYPQLIAPRLQATAGVGSRAIAGPAFDFFTYYFLMGRVLDMEPDLVVIVAHLASFAEKRGDTFTYNDLCSMIPTEELPHTVLLPLAAHRLSSGRVLLARLLRYEWGEEQLYFSEGLRTMWHDAPAWDVFGPKTPPPFVDFRFMFNAVRAYEQPISRWNPVVQMMGATVRMATRRGRRVLVLGIPIPHEILRERGWYDEAAYARRFAVLQAVVEESGGTFLDLHEALRRNEFADAGAHYNDAGAARMAELVEPEVRRMLGLPAAPGSAGLTR